MNDSVIKIKGARQHNLKNLDLEIPLQRFTVVTGVSGSGKSSLALDTLYAEGQRRYVETFSPYARQFMDRMDRPRVDKITGIPPAIAIDRKDPVRTSRSSVGTMTEITDYVKILFARLAVLHCASCGQPVVPETPQAIWQRLQALPEGERLVITFPLVAGQLDDDGSPAAIRNSLRRLGFDRLFHDGAVVDIDAFAFAPEDPPPDVVADRVVLRHDRRERTIDSLEMALRFGGGQLTVWPANGRRQDFSSRLSCARCGLDYVPPLPNLFSFNSPIGACDTCRGFGRVIDIDLDLIIPDRGLSLAEGAVKPWGRRDADNPRAEFDDLMDFCRRAGIPTDLPFRRLKSTQQRAIIDGTDGYYGIRGFFQWLETKTYKMHVRVFLSRYRSYDACPDCGGTRFKPETLLYRLAGENIAALYALNIDAATTFFDGLGDAARNEADRLVLDEVRGRLRYLQDVGLGYLTLDRQSRTLSGGE
nr:hypothetical protein [Desulfobacterales bacterium]